MPPLHAPIGGELLNQPDAVTGASCGLVCRIETWSLVMDRDPKASCSRVTPKSIGSLQWRAALPAISVVRSAAASRSRLRSWSLRAPIGTSVPPSRSWGQPAVSETKSGGRRALNPW